MQSNPPQTTPTLQTPANIKIKSWVGPNLTRITLSYLVIVITGITTFYFAKKEIDGERQKQMKIKHEINKPNIKYPSRLELIKAEKEKEKLANQQ